MYIKRIIRSLKTPTNYVTTYAVSLLQGSKRYYYGVPFLNLYDKVMGQTIPDNIHARLNKENSKVFCLTEEDIQSTLQILSKFGISAEEACLDPHIFCMNPISMDNYGLILKECNFNIIHPKHIIRYHTLVKSRTITKLKQDGLLKENLNLEKLIYSYFHDWPREYQTMNNFDDSQTNILTVRMSVLEKFLQWKLNVTSEEFQKYCTNYLPLKHRPMCDIKESLDIAQHNIKFEKDTIRRNGCILASDPVNTKLMLENVCSLGGMDIRDAIRTEPAILKNNYQSLLHIRSLLKQYNISNEAQKLCLKVYCMKPKTVQERLEQLVNLKEFQILASNPRFHTVTMALATTPKYRKLKNKVVYMVVHKRKMINRLTKIQAAKKQCYSLNHLVSSNKIFNTYINGFGNKVCSRDIAVLISSSLHGNEITRKSIVNKLKRHKYWLHTTLNVVNENLLMLKRSFTDDVIHNNCQILLYPVFEIEKSIEFLLKIRGGDALLNDSTKTEDTSLNNLKCSKLTDNQILSLVLYEIEKKHHFSGDGIWNNLEGGKVYNTSNQKIKLKYS